MPSRSTLPRPSGQPSPSASSFSTMKCMFATVNEYISRRNASSPVHRQMSATVLGNFAVSSVLPGSASAPKKTLPSLTTSRTTLPLDPFSSRLTSRRALNVVLDRLELRGRDRRERGVLAVGGEQPRIVGEAGGEPAGVVDSPDRRGEVLARVRLEDLQAGRLLDRVGDVLLA